MIVEAREMRRQQFEEEKTQTQLLREILAAQQDIKRALDNLRKPSQD